MLCLCPSSSSWTVVSGVPVWFRGSWQLIRHPWVASLCHPRPCSQAGRPVVWLNCPLPSTGRCPKPLKNRDVITLRSWLPMGTDYIIMNYSVKHPVS